MFSYEEQKRSIDFNLQICVWTNELKHSLKSNDPLLEYFRLCIRINGTLPGAI